MRYSEREPRGVETTPGAVAEVAELARGMLLRRLDGEPLSVAALLDSLDVDPAAREAVRSRVEVSSAHGAEDIDAARARPLRVELRRAGVGPHRRGQRRASPGGSAEGLGDRCTCRRRRSRSSGIRRRWRCTTARGEWSPTTASSRVPAAVLKTLPFEPALPADKRAALARLPIATAAKLFVPLTAPPEPSATLSVPERYWAWTALGADGAVTPVVNCFAGSPAALERLRVGEGPADWVASLRRLRPDLELDGAGAVVSTWDDPWAQGVYSVLVAGAPAGRRGGDLPRRAAARVLRRAHRGRRQRADGGRAAQRAPRCRGCRVPAVIDELTRAVGADHVMTDPGADGVATPATA